MFVELKGKRKRKGRRKGEQGSLRLRLPLRLPCEAHTYFRGSAMTPSIALAATVAGEAR